MSVLPELEQSLANAIRATHARPARSRRQSRIRRIALVLAAMLALSATALAATQPWASLDDAVDHGQRPAAPDRSLPVIGAPGTESLAQFRGKVVVLSFFASWCAPCREQTPLLEQTDRALAADGAGTALLVNWQDDADVARAFIAAHGLGIPVLADGAGLLAHDYDVRGLPETFVIDPRGRVVAISRQLVTRQFLDDAIAKARQPFAPDGD
jgi:cytochrome c biogenesis protein CcmG, thiol:disulfide interchange protein DsbE